MGIDLMNQVVYQIYPKTFCDSNGDGIGDINGIIQKLDYLESLGVNYLWLTPIYPSPQNDNGYDVSDYYAIDPMYGTMEDFERLIKRAAEHNMKIMMDMVLNHTSTFHQWFKKAKNGDKKYQDFYLFKASEDHHLPTNWQSFFGGDTWEYVDELGMYYLHLFDKTQADLNWRNPMVREEMAKIVNFWMEKGVKGFRFDVINLISKPKELIDDNDGDGRKFYTDGPLVHEYIHELNQRSFGKCSDIVTVGEMASTSIQHCIKYTKPERHELGMTFSFDHLELDYPKGDKWQLGEFDLLKLKKILFEWQIKMTENGGHNALFWCNHDQPRVVSRFGDDKKYWKESAKMLAATIHFMRGTPFIYQGEEIGMTNGDFKNINDYDDVDSKNAFATLKKKGVQEAQIYEILAKRSRDNARTPMQWTDEIYAGFSTRPGFLKVNANKDWINVKSQIEDASSILNFYKKLIKIRNEYEIVRIGDFQPILKDDPQVLAYIRSYRQQQLYVFCNFFDKPVSVKLDFPKSNFQVLVSNYDQATIRNDGVDLRPYETVVLLFK